MATIEANTFFYLGPGQWGYHDPTDTTFSSFAPLSTLNNYSSMVFQFSKSGVVDDLGFYVHSKITGSLTYYEVALKTLDTAGVPTTTNFGGSTGSVWSIDQIDVGWNWFSLGNPGTGTVGDFASAVIKRISASGVTGSLNMPLDAIGLDISLPRQRLLSDLTTFNGNIPPIAARFTDDFVIGLPATSFFSYQGDLADSPDEFGAVFSVPVRAECSGVKFSANPGSNNAPFTVLLYDSDDLILTSGSIGDEDYAWNAMVSPSLTSTLYFSPVWLNTGTSYRLIVRSNNSINVVYMGGVVMVTGTYRYCLPDGDRWMATYRTNTGSWTDVSNRVPYVSLVIDKLSYETELSGSTGTSPSIVTVIGEGSYGWAY